MKALKKYGLPMVLVTVCLFLTSGNLLAQEKSNLLYQGVYKIQGTKAKDLINGYEVGSSFDANEKVEIYEEEQENGQWLKSIEFKLPIISNDMKISLDNGSQIETVVLLSQQKTR